MNEVQEDVLVMLTEKAKENFSPQKLMCSKTIPDDVYCGKITSFDLEIIPDKVMKIYSRFVLTFEIKVVRGEYTSESVKVPFVVSPYFLCLETEEERLQKKIEDYRRKTLSTLRHLGIVISHSLSAMMFQIPRTIGNLIRFTVSHNGKSVVIDRLLKRVKSFDEMLEPDKNPFDD